LPAIKQPVKLAGKDNSAQVATVGDLKLLA